MLDYLQLNQDDWTWQGWQGTGQGWSQEAPEGSLRQHPGDHQARHPAPGQEGRCQEDLRPDLRGNPRHPEGLPGERHPRRCRLHRARNDEDCHRHGCRLLPQALLPPGGEGGEGLQGASLCQGADGGGAAGGHIQQVCQEAAPWLHFRAPVCAPAGAGGAAGGKGAAAQPPGEQSPAPPPCPCSCCPPCPPPWPPSSSSWSS